MRVSSEPSWSALMFFLIYWACITEPTARHTRDAMRNKERENKRQTETDVEAERWVAIGWQEVRGAKAKGRCEEKSGDRKAGWRTEKFSLFIFQKRSFGQSWISEESPVLVAPLIMDGPQACSRWARQPQPQLHHFKKPLVGLLPSPSSHSGRSEAPENSETSPREKGNQGLPVLQTDGSTHLEQIVGSNQATLLQCTAICGVKSKSWLEDAQDTSVRQGGKGHWCRWIVEQGVAC